MKRVLLIILTVINAIACEMESKLVSIDVISSIDMYVGDSIVLEVSHSPSNALVPAYHYRTSNRFVASVNDQGAVICNHVGSCTIRVATADTRFSSTCLINVKPKNNLFCEPVLDFFITKTAVKLKEINSTIDYENSKMLVFKDFNNPVQQVAYQFDENQKLITSVVKIQADVTSELTDFINERYDIFPTPESHNLLIWRGNDMEIVSKMVNKSCFVVYNPFSGKSTVESAISTIEMIRYNCK